MLGVMLDCSRNAVMKPRTVKNFADIIRKMGYDTLMLYTEDTYEVDSNPLFGAMRGKYTQSELRDIDEYCKNIGIELVPCIQTLAHLNCIFKWAEYSGVNDCDDILLAENEETYELIENMLLSVSKSFSSKKVHIGMDEAYRVGTGRYKDINGEDDRFEIINRHLQRVCKIAEKYGLEPMIWSDMFCKLALNQSDYYNQTGAEAILEKSKLPEGVSLVYWDYYSTDYDRYVNMINKNKLFGRKVYFAGGAWTWRGLAPDNDYSLKTTEAAVKACRDCGVDGMFFTVWGDDGGECTPFTILPSLMYAAEAAGGNFDMDSIKEKFRSIVGCEFDSFMLLDELNYLDSKREGSACAAKCVLYNDLFTGIKDSIIGENDSAFYKELAQRIDNAPKNGYEMIFEAYKCLAEVLAIKADLGIRTRAAYKAADKEKIGEIIKDYDILLERVESFHSVYQKMWFRLNKPHGFDIQDIRMGGLMQRIKSCRARLLAYMNDELCTIDELDEPAPMGTSGNQWSRIVSANVLSHRV